MNWQKLVIPSFELDIPTLLRSGQAFRWRNIDGVWSCGLNNQIVLIRTTTDNNIEFSHIDPVHPTITPQLETATFIHSYFNLNHLTSDLYRFWSTIDKNFPTFHNIKIEGDLQTPPVSERQTPIDDSFNGVRILSQDPWETLISFIISSNNNIKRISQLCEVLCITYGKHIGDHNDTPYYTFPQPNDFFHSQEITEERKSILEGELRSLGFGYRAKYIMKTVSAMIETPKLFQKLYSNWEEDEECIQFLRQFDGVGPKVADCVALMGCSRDDLVPVDTHVWNVLRNKYRKEFEVWVDGVDEADLEKVSKTGLKKSLVNKAVDIKVYPYVKQFFKEFWVKKAGWAQAVVFAGIVKLDNGINHADDIQKLINKVAESQGEVQAFKKSKKNSTV